MRLQYLLCLGAILGTTNALPMRGKWAMKVLGLDELYTKVEKLEQFATKIDTMLGKNAVFSKNFKYF